MEKQYIEIAKDFSHEIRKQYPNLVINALHFVSITEQDKVEVSSLPYNLEDAKYVIVIGDYDYQFHGSYSSNFFALFIDEHGRASNKLTIDNWCLYFDEPVTGGRRSPARHCYITNGDVCIDLNCKDCDMNLYISTIWSLFSKVMNCEDMEAVKALLSPYTIGNTTYLYKLRQKI